jgi:hypothetical protein
MVALRTSRCDPAAMDAGSEQNVSDSDSDSEVALDLKGRKHVDQDNNTHGVYWLDVKQSSSHTMFPMPGKAAADTLRQFLEDRLPAELITDDYGVVKPIAEIKDDRLPSLQAKLWHVTTDDIAKSSTHLMALDHWNRACEPLFNDFNRLIFTPLPVDNVEATDMTLPLAAHAAFVAGLLDGKLDVQLFYN